MFCDPFTPWQSEKYFPTKVPEVLLEDNIVISYDVRQGQFKPFNNRWRQEHLCVFIRFTVLVCGLTEGEVKLY